MFSTLSFSKGSQPKAFEDHSFAHDGSVHSTRRFACEICRAHKIKCSGDKLSCARCASLNIKCVYDGVSKPGSRSSRSQSRQGTGLAGTMKSCWSIHNPNKTSSSKHHRDNSSSIPRKEKDTIDNVADDEPPPTSKSPELDMTGSSSDGRTTILTCTLGSLHYDDGDASMDIMTDDSTLGDLDNRLDWSLINDEYAPAPGNSAFDPSTIQLPGLSLFQPSEHSSPRKLSSTFSSDSQPHPCSCSGRLSALLFSLNGHLRRPLSASIIPLEQSISRILAAHASAARLRDDMAACVSKCLKQPSNAVQLVMLIEQLVDFYTELVEQLSAAQYAVDSVQRASTTSADMALAIPVRIGEYIVENAAEKEAVIKLLVGGRIKALTKFTITCQEQLGTSGAGECSGRLNAAMQRLEVLRDA
ncbi:hypothetical protein O988_06653 [Pseudogymnoascus sp. VKM F-3808]|nr:hypothetical protein O988_06653 [Pseudogymnoascus sp. VKM F-3808]